MNPADQKKRFRVFAKQLENGIPPKEEQTQYLIHVFRGIASGRDPARILGVTYDNGKSKQDEVARANLDLVFHWIACATEVDITQGGEPIKPYSMTKAFEEGSKLAKKLFGDANTESYDPAYIKKMWYRKIKEHKASAIRSATDKDSIYEYVIPKAKK
jgi:hypothetical protein